jgi:5-(carboxyamino)imidazole ribonucleotide synthase
MNVGILGGGQLGRMLALAGYPLGFTFRFFDSSMEAPASYLADLVAGDYENSAQLQEFTSGLDVMTYEFENIPFSTVKFLEKLLPIFPSAEALEISQDRLKEKTLFKSLGIPTTHFFRIDSLTDLEKALQETGFPSVLKTRYLGYDGKGQFIIRNSSDIQKAWGAIGQGPLILEGWIPFEREVSVISVRAKDGTVKFYPLIENHHREGILRLSFAPAEDTNGTLQQMAENYATKILASFQYVGVLTIEFFQKDGQLIANEIAPRVHNSGHWTIEGAETSQFENHLRAISGIPLGSTAPIGYSAMINLIGEQPDISSILRLPSAHLHLYGKDIRPNRKIGHVTICNNDKSFVLEKSQQVRGLLKN